MLLTDVNNLPKFVFTGKKFLRRKEITDAIRGHIAVSGFLAMQNSQYGLITNLSRQFNVSRTFVSPHSLILNLKKLILHEGLAIFKTHYTFVENSTVASFFILI